MTVAEQIRIEVKSVDGRTLSYLDVVSRRSGVVDRGEFLLAEGDEATVEIDRSRARPTIVRMIQAPERRAVAGPVPPVDGASEIEATLLVDGKPFDPDAGNANDEEPEIGQVRTAEIRFSSFRTSRRDRGRTSKWRPCVVLRIDGDMVAVSPIHGVSSAVRRTGKGRRLTGWREVGLHKSSLVSAEQVWVHRSALGAPIGMLGPVDMARLGLDDRGEAP